MATPNAAVLSMGTAHGRDMPARSCMLLTALGVCCAKVRQAFDSLGIVEFFQPHNSGGTAKSERRCRRRLPRNIEVGCQSVSAERKTTLQSSVLASIVGMPLGYSAAASAEYSLKHSLNCSGVISRLSIAQVLFG